MTKNYIIIPLYKHEKVVIKCKEDVQVFTTKCMPLSLISCRKNVSVSDWIEEDRVGACKGF